MSYVILKNEDKLALRFIDAEHLAQLYKDIGYELQKRELNKLELEEVETWSDDKEPNSLNENQNAAKEEN